MSERVKLASIGLGRWARVLARGAQRGTVIELASCFSRSAESRAAFQAEFGVPRGGIVARRAALRPRDRGGAGHHPERHAQAASSSKLSTRARPSTPTSP